MARSSASSPAHAPSRWCRSRARVSPMRPPARALGSSVSAWLNSNAASTGASAASSAVAASRPSDRYDGVAACLQRAADRATHVARAQEECSHRVRLSLRCPVILEGPSGSAPMPTKKPQSPFFGAATLGACPAGPVCVVRARPARPVPPGRVAIASASRRDVVSSLRESATDGWPGATLRIGCDHTPLMPALRRQYCYHACMPVAITVRNVPEPVRDELAARAARSGRSSRNTCLPSLAPWRSNPRPQM